MFCILCYVVCGDCCDWFFVCEWIGVVVVVFVLYVGWCVELFV